MVGVRIALFQLCRRLAPRATSKVDTLRTEGPTSVFLHTPRLEPKALLCLSRPRLDLRCGPFPSFPSGCRRTVQFCWHIGPPPSSGLHFWRLGIHMSTTAGVICAHRSRVQYTSPCRQPGHQQRVRTSRYFVFSRPEPWCSVHGAWTRSGEWSGTDTTAPRCRDQAPIRLQSALLGQICISDALIF